MKKLICANWKMNKTTGETESFLRELLKALGSLENSVEVVIFPPFTSLCVAKELLRGSPLKYGAQNCFYKEWGAYTGEISPLMLKDLGCSYTIVGHSERRNLFGEDDETINKKLKALLKVGIRPILCVGEKIEERNANLTHKVIESQIRIALSGIEGEVDELDIAYEPVWAIGTGNPATVEDAKEVHTFINKLLDELNPRREGRTRILYGGSVKPSNAKEFLKEREVGGLLVGGASLEVSSFLDIVNSL